jgi:hypothetical protein
MDREKKYRLSFTAASLRVPEMADMAKLYLNEGPGSVTKESLIKGRSTKTAVRELTELKLRIETLTQQQLEVLAEGDVVVQKQIALLAVCKLYAFVRDFVVEAVREKALVFDYQLTGGEYTTFLRRKSEEHPELETLAESTAYKIKQVTFKMLEQAGIIDSIRSKKINPQLVDEKVIKAIIEDDPEWLKIYLFSDIEVTNRAN